MDALRAALILAVVTASGCANKCTLVVHPRLHANHDRPFYLVVRALKDQEFISDGYQRIAGLVFPTAADPSVKLVRLVSPGHDDKVQVTVPSEQSFGVYALFTEPGETWRVQVAAPLKSRYDVNVDGTRVTVRGPDGKLLDGVDADGLAEQAGDADTSSLGGKSGGASSGAKGAKAARGFRK